MIISRGLPLLVNQLVIARIRHLGGNDADDLVFI
jgi:hypothetical protein